MSEIKLTTRTGEPVLVKEYKHFRVYHELVRFMDGTETVFEYIWRRDGTRTIAVEDGKILLTKEYRHELERDDWRLPGGRLTDEHEPLVDAAKREFEEETGLKAKSWEYLWPSSPDSTVRYSRHFFLATQLAEGESVPEEGTVITVHWIDIARAREMALSGEIGEEISALAVLRLAHQVDQGTRSQERL